MDLREKTQSIAFIICPPEFEAQGDRLFEGHQKWVESTHHRDGDKALLQYNVSKGKDNNNNVIYVITALFEAKAGIDDHYALGGKFELVGELREWMAKCQVRSVEKATVINSLW